MWPFKSGKSLDQTEEIREFSWCEPGQALPMGKRHLRRNSGPLKLTGLGEATALCGRDLKYGWDLPTSTDRVTVQALSTPRPGDGHVWACADCVEESGILK